MSRKLLKIWFDESEHMIDYASTWRMSKDCREVLGEDFEDTMTFLRADTGGGTPKLIFTRGNTGRKYFMFLDSFTEVLHLNMLHNNQITAKFRYEKRGFSQGFKLLLDQTQQEELKRIQEAAWKP